MALSLHTEIRAVIKFCQEIGKSPTETDQMIQTSSHKNCVSLTTVFEWHKRFVEGRSTLEDNKRCGRKKNIRTTLTSSIADALEKGKKVTVCGLSETFGASYGTIYRILMEELHMSKVHARWVPRVLKDHEFGRRVQDSRIFLRRADREGDIYMESFITTDETWLWLYYPETKAQSAVWKHSDSPPPKKARVTKSGGKVMFIMSADIRGMLLMHAVPHGKTVNAAYYSKVLRRDLADALRRKCREIPLEHFIIHMGYAPSHTAEQTQLEIGIMGLGTIRHPPYADLAPFDCTIKRQLKGQRFLSLAKLTRHGIGTFINNGFTATDVVSSWRPVL